MSEPADRNRASSTLIVIVYAVLALAATGRSSVQLPTAYSRAPLAHVLPALPAVIPDEAVWSHCGAGYGYVPLVLPWVGLWWLRRHPQ